MVGLRLVVMVMVGLRGEIGVGFSSSCLTRARAPLSPPCIHLPPRCRYACMHTYTHACTCTRMRSPGALMPTRRKSVLGGYVAYSWLTSVRMGECAPFKSSGRGMKHTTSESTASKCFVLKLYTQWPSGVKRPGSRSALRQAEQVSPQNPVRSDSVIRDHLGSLSARLPRR